MKFKVKDLSKCVGNVLCLPVAMEKFSNKVLEFDPDKYGRIDVFMHDDWYFEADWLEPVEEVTAPTKETTESRPTLLALPDDVKIMNVSDLVKPISDPVSKPSHYHFSEYEPVKVIQAWGLSFCLGNVVKYIARAGRKDSSKLIEDLEKAKRYIELELEDLRKK